MATYDVGINEITGGVVNGVQRLQQKVTGKQGEVQLNISHLSPGTYIVNLQADGINIAQQKLIKK